jgi:hypothetical protein
MEGFKTLAKGVKCFKEGGSVYKSRHSEKTEKDVDVKQDKAIVKKAFAMHDKQEHKGEKTDLSKLKNGGRAKKKVGTVKKFEKASGEYGAKKGPADKKNIQQAKLFKPAFKKGGKVKKYSGEDGSWVDKGIDAVKSAGKSLYENVMGTEEQNRIAKQQIDEQATKGSKLAKFFGGKAQAPSAPVQKCGGGSMKKKKYAAGGSIDEDVRERARKWIEAGSPENTETAETPVAPAKPVRRAKPAKLPMPDYSNEDLDRMGMNKDLKQPEFDREEHSPWMREYRKEEAKTAEKTRRSKRTPGQMLREESEYTIKPDLQVKGERLMKNIGMKRGGKAKKMMTGGTCS